MATIKDLSAMTGISKSTISRVINNEPNVSEKTRNIVMDAIRETNFTPNIMARGMVTGKLPIVLIIVGDIQNYYFNNTIVGIERVLSGTNYLPVVYNSMYDDRKEKMLIETAVQSRFAGIIPMTGVGTEELLTSFEGVDCPVVLINKWMRKSPYDAVLGDEQEASYLATGELIKLGHKKIAYISGDSKKSRISREREEGFKEAVRDAGLKLEEDLIYPGALDVASGYQLGEELLVKKKLKAICSNSYLMAAGIIKYGEEIGLRPMIDYDIACCECVSEVYSKNIIFAGPDLEKIGEKAAELLLKRIKGSKEPPQRVSFSVTSVHNPKIK